MWNLDWERWWGSLCCLLTNEAGYLSMYLTKITTTVISTDYVFMQLFGKSLSQKSLIEVSSWVPDSVSSKKCVCTPPPPSSNTHAQTQILKHSVHCGLWSVDKCTAAYIGQESCTHLTNILTWKTHSRTPSFCSHLFGEFRRIAKLAASTCTHTHTHTHTHTPFTCRTHSNKEHLTSEAHFPAVHIPFKMHIWTTRPSVHVFIYRLYSRMHVILCFSFLMTWTCFWEHPIL